MGTTSVETRTGCKRNTSLGHDRDVLGHKCPGQPRGQPVFWVCPRIGNPISDSIYAIMDASFHPRMPLCPRTAPAVLGWPTPPPDGYRDRAIEYGVADPTPFAHAHSEEVFLTTTQGELSLAHPGTSNSVHGCPASAARFSCTSGSSGYRRPHPSQASGFACS